MATYTYPVTDFADNYCNTKRFWDQLVAASLNVSGVRSLAGIVYVDSTEAEATIAAEVASYVNDFSPGQDVIELFADGGGNIALDLLAGSNAFVLNLDGNYTLSNPTDLNIHDTFLIQVNQVGGGNTLSFDTDYIFPGGTPPTITAADGAVDLLTLYAAYPSVMVAHSGDMS